MSCNQVPRQKRKEVAPPPDKQEVVPNPVEPKVNNTTANKDKPNPPGQIAVVGVLSDISGKVGQTNEGDIKKVDSGVTKMVDSRKCEHGKWKRTCKDCGGSAICEHRKQSKSFIQSI